MPSVISMAGMLMIRAKRPIIALVLARDQRLPLG